MGALLVSLAGGDVTVEDAGAPREENDSTVAEDAMQQQLSRGVLALRFGRL